MTSADTNRIRLSYVEEVVFGTTPNSTLKDMRVTSDTLKQVTGTQKSAEIQSTRQITDVVRLTANAAGDTAFEFTAESFDDMIVAALGSSGWSNGGAAVTVTATTISAAAADNSFNDSGAGFGSMVAGQWVRVSGFATSANNGYFKIVSKTSSKIVVSGGTLVNEAATPSVTVTLGSMVTNGTTLVSFSLERKYTDLTNTFARFVGMMIAGLSTSIKADGIITGSINWLGKQELSATATAGSGYTSANTNNVMTGVDSALGVIENGAALADVNAVDFSINNNLRQRLVIGTLGPKSLGAGDFEVTGKVQAYFESSSLIDKYLAFTSTSLAIPVEDEDGNGYVFEWPEIKFTDGQRVAGGKDQDVMADLTFMSKKDPSEGVTMRVTRFA